MEKKFWQKCWSDQSTPWNIGEAHPLLGELLDLWHRNRPAFLDCGTHMYVPGCGHAHDAAYFAKTFAAKTATDTSKHLEVLACDWIADACQHAKTRYGDVAGLTIELADALICPTNSYQSTDFVFDRAMLCALDPNRRNDYIAALAARLKPNGHFLGIIFGKIRDDITGPPFALDESDLLKLFNSDFSLIAAQSCSGVNHRNTDIDSILLRHWLCIWQRRPEAG